MSFTPNELVVAANTSLDNYFRNKPIDQIDQARPFFSILQKGKKPMSGGKQYAVEQLRYRYQSNLQWMRGSATVTYNRRRVNDQAKYEWGGWHDGFSEDEDSMLQNGINIAEGKPRQTTDNDFVQLNDMMEENGAVLRLGAVEKFDQALLLDGSQDAEAIVGLDGLVSLTPTSGTVGGIAASNAWWQNKVQLNLTTTAGGTINDGMEDGWRDASRNAKTSPNFIMGGTTFIKEYRKFLRAEGMIKVNYDGGKPINIDASTGEGVRTGLFFKGVEIVWNPVFDDLDTLYSPATPWAKRCYFLNMRHLTLRPIRGHDMITRKPPRVYDSYQYYWGLTWKGALTMNQRNAHVVCTIV